MKTYLLLVIASVAAILGHASAAQPAPQLGLQISLVPGGYVFDVTPRATPALAKRPKATAVPATREHFACGVVVFNRSTVDFTLKYGSATAAADRFAFRIYSAQGDIVWDSGRSALAEPATVILKKKSVLRRTMQIPLKVNGTWLSTGAYVLEATAGLNGPSATTVFEVIAPLPTPPAGGSTPTVPPTVEPEPPVDEGTENPPPPPDVPYGEMNGGVRFVSDAGKTGLAASITLTALGTSGSVPAGTRFSTHTDADGNYVLTAPSAYYLITVHPDDPSVKPGGVAYPDVVGEYGGPRAHIEIVSGKSETIFYHYIKNELYGTVPAPLPISISTTFIPKLEGQRYASLDIGATTTTPTGGYSKPILVVRNPPPRAEVIEFDFYILPPSGLATTAFQNHTTTYRIAIGLDSTPIRKFRVYGQGGSVEIPFDPASPNKP